MLLVTQNVFPGGDDSQRPWSDRYLSTKRACFLDCREDKSAPQSARESQRADSTSAKDQGQDLAGLSSQQLYELWKSGANPAATLEMALRYVGPLSPLPLSPPLLARSSNSKLKADFNALT